MAATVGLISVPKSCDVLAERLRGQILLGRYAPGDPLPTERDLAVETGLSRGSIREALRILEAQGLVRTRTGRHGGSIVCRPTDDQLGSHIDLYAKARGVSVQALAEARLAIEPMVAYLAAQRRTDADLAELHRLVGRLEKLTGGRPGRFLEENLAWHHALAVASHNDLLRTFAASVSRLMDEASRVRNFVTRDVRVIVIRSHRRILQAIDAGDAEAARRRSARAIDAYARTLSALLGSGGRG